MKQSNRAAQYIKLLNLIPHPEGGWYIEQFRSLDAVQTVRHNTVVTRAATTVIYYLLENKNFSVWHCLRSDETWFYHAGTTPIVIHCINKQGAFVTLQVGDPLNNPQAVLQATLLAEEWFCASLLQSEQYDYALVSCAVSPSFEFDDFEIGNRACLIASFPHYKDKIIQFTR